MFLYHGPVCKEGCIATCSKGKSSGNPNTYGGWSCLGCQYNNRDEYIAENGEDNETPNIFKKDLGNVNLHLDVDKIREAIQEVKKNRKFTKYQVIDYIMGWSLHDQHWFSVEDIKSMLNNTLNMLEDEQDGIKATFDRRKQNDK